MTRYQTTVDSAAGLVPFGHLGWAYRDRDEFALQAGRYLADGLAQGQMVEYVGDGDPDTLRRELAGETVRAGEMLSILIGGANRDPARFPDPDRFSLRRGAGAHLSFAAGPHYCVGATLARAEAEIAVATLARRVPNLALATDDVVFRPNVILRGMEALPVTLR